LNNLGYVLQGQGDIDGAVAAYEETLRQDPTYAAAYNNLGNVYKDVGDFTRAAAAYRRALDYQPDFARAIFNLTDVKTFTDRNDPDFARLATQAVRLKDLPAAQARYIHFAMGKALDDIGAADESFAHVMAGNAVVRSLTNYDEAAALGQVEGAAARRVGGQGVASETPIFIVGMPRSGTTLVEQILASHPAVRGGGERRDFDHALQATGGHDARRLGEGYLARLPNLAPGQTRITDKLPANFLYAGLIHTALPQARIIHVMRDPADTCLSCFTKLFDTGQEFTYNLGELGRYYVAYARLMRHWRTVLPEHAFIEISYETLVADLEEQTRRLLSFCGLAWDPACLAFHTTQRVVQTASATQVRKPLYTSSIGRAAAFQNHLAPLLTELAKL
jgi:tetratricopeptide (TPR) repeat protein